MSRQTRMVLLTALLISIMLFVPFISDTISYEHDTFFHLSRIEGLATAIRNLDFFPKVYPFKNDNFGYGSPMFYSDFFLLVPAVIYNLTGSIVIAYKFLVFALIFLTAFFMGLCSRKFTDNRYMIILSMALYSFATYHITDIYVRSAVGELFGFCLLPLVILAAYRLIFEDDRHHLLAIVISCLILSHNLSFIMACLMLLGILIMNCRRLNLRTIRNLLIDILLVIGFTAFFTFPMIEQFLANDLYCEHPSAGLLMTSTLKSFQFLMTRMNFYIFTNDYNSMAVNTGLLILLLPLARIFIIDRPKDDKSRFIVKLMVLGYLSLLIQSSLINYEKIYIFYAFQFIWRFMLLSCVLLSMPAAFYSMRLAGRHQPAAFTIIVCISVGITSFLLYPALNRTNVIHSDTSYEELIDGSVIDPYYSAFYVRVELAGADYLHTNSIDYQNYDYQITDLYGQAITSDIDMAYNTLSFTLDCPGTTVVLPKTYYKGYQVYNGDKRLTTYIDPYTSLVAFDTLDTSGEYIMKYDGTITQKISILISLLSAGIFIFMTRKKF